MQPTNWARIVLGGLLAGIVINAVEFVLHFFVLEEAWTEAGETMSGKGIAALNIWGFLVGLIALWVYSVLRDRLGQGARTAIYAGVFVWALTCLLVRLRPDVLEVLAGTARITSLAVVLVAIVAGTLLGAWQYREPAEPSGSSEPGAD